MENDVMNELQQMNEVQQTDLASSLKEINELANQAFLAKENASLAEAKAKELKNKLSTLMESAGVDKISADNCTVSGKIKASASVPKVSFDKLDLFAYIASKDSKGTGQDAIKKELTQVLLKYPTLLNMLTFNATSFNSWYAKEQEVKINEGQEDWALPFVSTYEYYSVGMRKKRK